MSEGNEFEKYLKLVAKRKTLFFATAMAIMTAFAVAAYVLPRKYEAKSTVYIEKSVISDLVKGIAVTSSVEEKLRVLTYAITSRTLLMKVMDDLDLGARRQTPAETEELVKKFQKNTEVKLKDKEGLFMISFTDSNPRLASDYVNTVVRRYIEENLSYKRDDSLGATKFIGEQAKTFRARLDKADEELRRFRDANASVLATDGTRLEGDIAAARVKLDELKVARVRLEGEREALRHGGGSKGGVAEMENRLAALRATYTDDHPAVRRLLGEIEEARAAAPRSGTGAAEVERISLELKSVTGLEAAQRRIISEAQAKLRSLPTVRARVEDLEREKNTSKGLYDQLVAREGQSEVSKQVEIQDKAATYRIVDPAIVPVKPVSPDRVRIIVIGIFAAFAGALALLVLLDRLDNSVRTPEAVRATGLPVFAVIPQIDDPSQTARTRRIEVRTMAATAVCVLLLLVLVAGEAADVSVVDVFSAALHQAVDR